MRSAETLTRFITVFVILLGWSMGRPQGLGAQEVCTITQLTDADRDNFTPVISDDGTRVVFGSDELESDSTEVDIRLLDITTNTLSQLATISVFDTFQAAINADGTRIVFSTDSDLTGQNADGSDEVFLFDTLANTLSQVTNTVERGLTIEPVINGDGTRIAFTSRASLTGQNPDGSLEIFLLDRTTNVLTQVTSSPDRDQGSSFPSINADGTRIAFTTRPDRPLNNGQLFLLDEIAVFDTTTNALTQLTDFPDGSSDTPAINVDGTRIAFRSCLPCGSGTEEREKIFLFDTTTDTLTQLADAAGKFHGEGVTINADGTRIAFESDANLTGQNADGNREVFVFDTTTNVLTQLTNSITEGFGGSFEPTINADGTRIAFYSDSDLTGQNPDGSLEIFLADCSSSPPQGVLENPQPNSFQSGIGVISGWVCSASVVEIEFDGEATFEAAYGTSRGDTVGVCGDANNGFSLLFNWNLLGDGEHTVRILADGVEVASVTVTVTTLGLGEFPTGLSGAFTLMDFPAAGAETNIEWQQSQQNFVIVSGSGSGRGSSGSGMQVLENPQPGAFQSGIGVLSGFVCDATLIEIIFDDGAPFEAAYGTSRGDTQGICGDANNGFSLLFNWNLLGDGLHTVRALADGVEFANVTITVTTLGLGEFPTGLSGAFTLADFPMVGDATNVQWQQSQQNFVIVDVQ